LWSATQTTEVITTSNSDLRLVRIVTKRWDRDSGPTETEQVPEILDYNRPVPIPAGTSQQFWLTIYVPPETAPGPYHGTISVSPGNAAPRSLGLDLTVLPFTLAPPDRGLSMSYTPLTSFAGVPLPGDPFVYLWQDHQDIRVHGMNSGAVYTPVTVTLGAGGAVEVDYSGLIQNMDMLREMGFSGPAHWRGIFRLYRDLQRLHVPTATLEATYTGVVSTVLSLRAERGWPEIYFFPVDEPFGDPAKEAELYYLGSLIKQVPGALVEVSLGGAGSLPPEADPFTDVRSYSGWRVDRLLPVQSFQDIADQAVTSGDRLGLYYNTRNMGGRPDFSRATWGLYLWNSPFEGEGVWTYHVFMGDPYDDTDGPTGDLAYAYPDPARGYAPMLPTLRWEGTREGIDDLRYLYTLEQAIATAQNDPSKAEAVARAQALLAQLRTDIAQYGPELRGIIARFSGEDYAHYRWAIAQAISELLSLRVSDDAGRHS